MLQVKRTGSQIQALKRNKITQNELTIIKLHRLQRPNGGFLKTGLDMVSFILRFPAYFGVFSKIKKRLNPSI